MATLTFIEKQKNALVKKFHTLLTKGRIGNDQKLQMLAAYGVESSKDLNVYELTELCGKLDKIINPAVAEQDKWRNWVLTQVGHYCKSMGFPSSDEYRKALVCQAARCKDFNSISVNRLKSLYNAFNKMRKDLQNVRELTEDKIQELTTLN